MITMEQVKANMIRLLILSGIVALCCSSCKDEGEPLPGLTPDAQLFNLVMRVQPFTSYSLFPKVDSVTSGRLIGSTAHQPMVRVSMNATALSALRADTLPIGTSFPDGSIIFKEIRDTIQTPILYAIEYKDRSNPLASNGWLWAEYHIDGSVAYSVTNVGRGCIGCHSLEQGPQHDFVRTFERQH